MSTTIKFASKPENITIVEQFVEDLRIKLNMGSTVYEDIIVAFTEAANNAMTHGNKENEEKNVEVWCKLDERSQILSLVVRDEGPGFDYFNLPDPTSPENIQRVNGRGVFLMRELSHAVFYSNRGSTVDMLFSL